jgi:hypothetical protein
MGNFWIVPLLHSVSDVTVSCEYDYVSLDVVKGGAFLESTTRAAARPGNLREIKYCFGFCNNSHKCSVMSCSADAGNLSPWLIQRPGHVADPPPLASAEVKNECSCSPSPSLHPPAGVSVTLCTFEVTISTVNLRFLVVYRQRLTTEARIQYHMGFMMGRVALRQVFLQVLRFFLPISFRQCSVLILPSSTDAI